MKSISLSPDRRKAYAFTSASLTEGWNRPPLPESLYRSSPPFLRRPPSKTLSRSSPNSAVQNWATPSTRLVIIPLLNPDGIIASTRDQASSIDINRDFLSGRFRAPETRAMKALLEQVRPDILIDFQGWLYET